MSRFNECLAFVLQWEGGFVNDPDDPGGATNKGITQGVYDHWLRRQDKPRHSVENISDDEVAAIYKADYWDQVAKDLQPPLDLAAFDTAVNCGVARAIRWLSYCWNGDAVQTKECLLKKRRAHYDWLIARRPTMVKFRKGWTRRVDALALAG